MIFDTHAHYDDKRFDCDRDALLGGLPNRGVGLVLNPGCDLKSSKAALDMASRYSHVFAAVGVHPHEAKYLTPEWLSFFGQAHSKRVAIGEIGLDYHYDHSPRDVQISAFRAQMELASGLKLPVIIHDREAHEDTLRVLREFPDVCGVLHCYSGSREMAKILVQLGYYIGFTGALTFKNARRAVEVAQWLPEERILLETDCPYMTPEPHRGKRCDSSFLPLVATRLAEIRGVDAEHIVGVTEKNGRVLFGIERV